MSPQSTRFVRKSWQDNSLPISTALSTNNDPSTLHLEKPVKLSNDILIGDNCWIGANVFVRGGVQIGNNTTIGANSVVTKSFPENSIIAGVPARLIKKLDERN
ncbi:MAG: hypothetical protein EBU01_14295 [Crocinitomicaceae bacterium]|nr:hypothetical protein [Crocinitomicaceae bacterium]